METKENDIVKVGNIDCKVILSPKTLQLKISNIASQIYVDYKDRVKPPVLLIVTNGAIYFGVHLSMALEKFGLSLPVDTIRIKRYREDGKPAEIKIISEPQIDLSGRDVIVVEDVIDEGITLNFLHKYLKSKNPKSIEYCVLIEKSKHIVLLDSVIEYKILDNFGDGWLIGFGMDSDQLNRGLDFVCIKLE